MGVRIKFWLEKDGELVFGSGRRDLLRMLRKLGSLNRAAKEFSMSYRAAWGKIRATEERLGWKLVEAKGRKRHLTLTPQAEDLLERYTRFENEATDLIQKLYKEHFPEES